MRARLALGRAAEGPSLLLGRWNASLHMRPDLHWILQPIQGRWTRIAPSPQRSVLAVAFELGEDAA